MHFSDEKGSKLKYLPTFVFIIFIFSMGIWFIFSPKAEYSSSEKRILTKFPSADFENVASGKFGDTFEKFFADHFPNRRFWVGFDAYYNLSIGDNGSNGVYYCSNDYLINKPVSEDNNINKNLNAISNFATTIDVPVTAMFVPSTGYVVDDVLPTLHNKYDDDKYFSEISKTLSLGNVGFVDLRQTFKTAYSNGNQLYYKTDHHWTTLGAYTGYTKLCEALNITPTSKSNYKISSYNGFYGTTYSTSGFWGVPADEIQLWENPANTTDKIDVKITEGTKRSEYNSMFFKQHLKQDDKYPVFIDGNHAVTEITNKNAKGGTIILIKDSFSHSIAPFLSDNYSKVILVDMRYYKMNVSDIVKKENPQQVVVLYGIDNFATDTDLVWLQ